MIRRRGIDPDMAPGGIVVRIRRADGTVVLFEPIPDTDLRRAGQLIARHDRIAYDNSTPGAPATIEAFDGDSGRFIKAFVVIAADDTDTTGPDR